jgi:hypothetical protein
MLSVRGSRPFLAPTAGHGEGLIRRYALLILPSSNRVYGSASVAMTWAELEVFNRSVLDNRPTPMVNYCVPGHCIRFMDMGCM